MKHIAVKKVVLFCALIIMAAYEAQLLYAAAEDPPATEQKSADKTKPPVRDKDKKQLILRKNIFEPARKTTPTGRLLSDPGIDPGPQPLKRPFRVIGIINTGGEVRADLLREDPREIRTVKVGDLIETVEIQHIGSTYLKCLYAGSPIRIDVGESSNDALRRLLGLYVTSAYYLMGTTVLEETSYAQFYFPREGRYARVSEGDMLGEYQVVRIEPGRVFVEDEYGFQIPIQPITPPNP